VGFNGCRASLRGGIRAALVPRPASDQAGSSGPALQGSAPPTKNGADARRQGRCDQGPARRRRRSSRRRSAARLCCGSWHFPGLRGTARAGSPGRVNGGIQAGPAKGFVSAVPAQRRGCEARADGAQPCAPPPAAPALQAYHNLQKQSARKSWPSGFGPWGGRFGLLAGRLLAQARGLRLSFAGVAADVSRRLDARAAGPPGGCGRVLGSPAVA